MSTVQKNDPSLERILPKAGLEDQASPWRAGPSGLEASAKNFHHHGYKPPGNLKKSCEKGEDTRIGFEIAPEIEENIKDNLN
jgi:hypothetical protein